MHNQINKDGRLSIIHINSRSLYANFENIKNYLHSLAQPFSIIALSETWMHKGKKEKFELDGYDFVHKD